MHRVPVLCVAALLVCSTSLALDLESEVEAALSVGHDTNPLHISGDGPGAAAAALDLDAGLTLPLQERSVLFLQASGATRLHDGDASNANESAGTLSLGWAREAEPGRRLSLAAGMRAGWERSTFTDRFTGEPYRIVDDSVDPAESWSLEDRFDEGRLGAFVDARWRLAPRWILRVDGAWDEVDHAADYEDVPGIDPLDHRLLELAPSVAFRAHDALSVSLGVAVSDVRYDRRQALDADGDAVEGTRRHHRSGELRLSVRVAPARGWLVRGGWSGGSRDDLQAGYHDYSLDGGWMSVERRLGETMRARLSGSRRSIDYTHATVTGSLEDALLGSEVERWAGRFEHGFRKSLRWFAEAGTQSVESSDAEFAHDRSWIMTGIELHR